jgi:hypothetical protein
LSLASTASRKRVGASCSAVAVVLVTIGCGRSTCDTGGAQAREATDRISGASMSVDFGYVVESFEGPDGGVCSQRCGRSPEYPDRNFAVTITAEREVIASQLSREVRRALSARELAEYRAFYNTPGVLDLDSASTRQCPPVAQVPYSSWLTVVDDVGGMHSLQNPVGCLQTPRDDADADLGQLLDWLFQLGRTALDCESPLVEPMDGGAASDSLCRFRW